MKYLIFVFLLASTLSCEKSKYKKISEYYDFLDTLNVDDYDSYRNYKTEISKIKPTKESFCLLDSLKAEIDIKKGKLNYFIEYNNVNSLSNLPEYLKSQYSINTIELFSGCIITDDDKYYECYQRLMHKAIAEKYGDEFINKSKRTVDSIYHHKNKDIIYSRSNSYGMFKRHKSAAYNSWKDSIQNAIEKIKCSIISKSKINKDTNISARFIITKSGEIDSLELYSLYIGNKDTPYLKKQLKDFILKTKWQPVKLYGLKLNTKEYLFM